MGSVKIMAKDLVRTRQYITKFIEMRSHLQGASLKLQTVKSHQALAESMSATAKAMIKMNKAVSIPAITKMMGDFQRENEKSELMQEMMGDAMDDAMEEEGQEEEQDKIVSQVLDEIGIQFDAELGDAPMGMKGGVAEAGGCADAKVAEPMGMGIPAAPTGQQPKGGDGPPAAGGEGGGDSGMSELEARLNNLRR